MATESGKLSRMIYKNGDFGIAKITGNGKSFTVKGPVANLTKGIVNQFTGTWEMSKYGRELCVSYYVEDIEAGAPTGEKGIIKYLSSSRFEGIGKKTAKKIYERFGKKSIDVVLNHPEKLREAGISSKIVDRLSKAANGKKSLAELNTFLASHGMSARMCSTVIDELGPDCLSAIRDNPYVLTKVPGIGFLKADVFARSMGIKADASCRLRAGVIYALDNASGEGHMYLPMDELVEESYKITGFDCTDEIRAMTGFSLMESDGIYIRGRYFAEKRVANDIHELSGKRPALKDEEIKEVEKKLCITYDESQKKAIKSCMENGFSVITGGPGVGKTTVINGIIKIYKKRGKQVVLCAPTGRAAKRMSEATDHKASTIHRLLEYNGKAFKRNKENPLDGEVLIVDEASMIDTWLMSSLLEAAQKMNVILVGDADQLPSVGPGNVLKDIIASGCVPVARMTHIHRQSRNSTIVEIAHQINEGVMPDLNDSDDFRFIEVHSAQEAMRKTCELASGGLRYADVQVLTPIHKSDIGTDALNEELSCMLNPGGEKIRDGALPLYEGDRVMQTKNDYNLNVFNGDMGILRDRHHVEFDEEVKKYGTLTDIVQSYAITVHKSQGSEYQAAVIVMPKCRMNYRNLLYTAITRCKKMCVLVSTEEAVRRCVMTDDPSRRYTHLKERIITAFKAGPQSRISKSE